MNGLPTTVRHVLGRARRLPTRLARTGRRPLAALGLAATVLATALVPPAPVNAADPPQEPPKPAARVQVLLKSVYIYDDRDPGDGEMNLEVHLSCFAVSTPCLGQPKADLDDYEQTFSASTGDTVTLNRLLPASAPANPQYAASVDTGYPLYPGQAYQLDFSVLEHDWFSADDLMGDRHIMLTQENGWAVGTYKLRSTDVNCWGDYEIEFEVRRAPLPDLRPTGVTVYDLPGSAQRLVCVAIDNAGVADAGPFDFWLFVDGRVQPDSVANAGKLAAGGSGELCGQNPVSLSPGQHQISPAVDPEGVVTEFDETNNAYQRSYAAALQPASASTRPTPTPSPSQADLTVSVIKVNGQVPDAKDDCRDGKNDVAVVVKNAGTAKAGDFAVRLVVDGDSGAAKEELVADGLDAGQEHEVRFDGVRLKQGERTLTAIADAKSTVAEAKEDNNELKVSARCKDDD